MISQGKLQRWKSVTDDGSVRKAAIRTLDGSVRKTAVRTLDGSVRKAAVLPYIMATQERLRYAHIKDIITPSSPYS